MKNNLRSAWNSRQYMLKRDFEIYYYSDTHFHSGKDHTHDYYEFYIFLDGDASIEIEKKVHPLQEGDVILIPPGVHHHAIIHDENVPYSRFVFWISQNYCNSLLKQSPDYVWLMQRAVSEHRYVFHNSEVSFRLIQSMILELLREIRSDRFGHNTAAQLQVSRLLLQINRAAYEQGNRKYEAAEGDRLENIILYIEEHLSENITLETLADKFYVSTYTISHLFKDSLGISVHQYILKQRLEGCRSALLRQKDVGRIYEDYGFHDYSVFYRAFKKEYGLSPKEYQKVYREDPMQKAGQNT
jgi:AraC-like DNA-binding protein